ncbi:MAG: hypothetical protein OEZ22_09300 [Spirochaetia bacterium]|nr:hypothetical protein [Spirochaetia bacterium]
MTGERKFYAYITLALIFIGIIYTFWPEVLTKKTYNEYIVSNYKKISNSLDYKKIFSNNKQKITPLKTSDNTIINHWYALKSITVSKTADRLSLTNKRFQEIKSSIKIHQ